MAKRPQWLGVPEPVDEVGFQPLARRYRALWVALLLLAVCRFGLQIVGMPPYAGLDELFHVARFAFHAEEGRHPTLEEPSIPVDLARALHAEPGHPPSFAAHGARWAELLERGWSDAPTDTEARSQYALPNYQAQQPSLYYSLWSGLPAALGAHTLLRELLVWRLLSALFAVVALALTTALAVRLFGPAGFVAGAVLVLTPNWLVLTLRAGNDAFTVLLVSAALLLALCSRGVAAGLGEAAAWAGAVASKLTAGPALGVALAVHALLLPAPVRLLLTLAVPAGALALVAADLGHRTSSPLGLQQFAGGGADAAPWSGLLQADYGEAARIFVSSAIWMPGEHGNALTPLGMGLFALPLAAALAAGLVLGWRHLRTRRAATLAGIGLVLFAAAQGIHFAGFARRAATVGETGYVGGAEGWYLLSLAALWAVPLAAACTGLAHWRRWAPLALLGWIAAWDVVLHEGGLFHDWAGLSDPARLGLLFRWGGFDPPGLAAALGAPGIGLRLSTLMALAAFLWLWWRRAG